MTFLCLSVKLLRVFCAWYGATGDATRRRIDHFLGPQKGWRRFELCLGHFAALRFPSLKSSASFTFYRPGAEAPPAMHRHHAASFHTACSLAVQHHDPLGVGAILIAPPPSCSRASSVSRVPLAHLFLLPPYLRVCAGRQGVCYSGVMIFGQHAAAQS